MPQDVQAEAFEFPGELLEKRVWTIARPRPDRSIMKRGGGMDPESKKPMIIAGGGVIYGEATAILRKFVQRTGIPVGETFAGKGSLNFDDPSCLGAVGVTGTPGANIFAREADLIIGIGTRYSDFTTCSKTAFQNPHVRFININIGEFDAFKHAALPVVADAKVTLEELDTALQDYHVSDRYRARAAKFNKQWDAEVCRIYNLKHGVPASQGEVVGAVNDAAGPRDILLCAAGSLPGDLHKLWRTRDPKGFHLEYGYSTMGYEVAGGLGAKMAAPDREVYVMVGDGNYLMMGEEIITSVQEGHKMIIVLLNNNGFASIGGLSESIGSKRFGTKYRFRNVKSGQLDGDVLPVDFAGNARSLGAHVIECTDIPSLRFALEEAKKQPQTTVITIETDIMQNVGGYESWWEVAVSEVAGIDSVNKAYKEHKKKKKKNNATISDDQDRKCTVLLGCPGIRP